MTIAATQISVTVAVFIVHKDIFQFARLLPTVTNFILYHMGVCFHRPLCFSHCSDCVRLNRSEACLQILGRYSEPFGSKVNCKHKVLLIRYFSMITLIYILL